MRAKSIIDYMQRYCMEDVTLARTSHNAMKELMQHYYAEQEELLLACVAAGVPLSNIIVQSPKLQRNALHSYCLVGSIKFKAEIL